MSEGERYYVDDRTGCIAVRDRDVPNPNGVRSPGLHEDDPGVVWFGMHSRRTVACPTCGHNTTEWGDDPELIKSAEDICAKLNKEVKP